MYYEEEGAYADYEDYDPADAEEYWDPLKHYSKEEIEEYREWYKIPDDWTDEEFMEEHHRELERDWFEARE